MSFANDLRFESSLKGTYTENGAYCLATSGDKLVDLFATIGALRYSDEDRIIELFENAIAEDKLLATKILFYGRDIREGLGERKTFRTLLAYAADKYPEIVIPNINLIGLYGRYDDLYSLVGTQCEDEMWKYMKGQFKLDLDAMAKGKSCSLLAKWIKTPNATSANTKRLGVLTSQKFGYKNVGFFKKDLKKLRKYLDIVEIKISANRFSEIIYSTVPAMAKKRYSNLFIIKDKQHYTEYLALVEQGKAKINTSTLYPYDIIQEYFTSDYYIKGQTLKLLWNNLPNYIDEGTNILVMADTSGSMNRNNYLPISSALGLAIYFAERAKGPFHDMFMTFSKRPMLQKLVGNDVFEKIQNMDRDAWDSNTNLDLAFELILDTAIKYNTPASEMPNALVIISDMQIDGTYSNEGVKSSSTFYDVQSKKFKDAGYKMPQIIFWNVNSTSNTFHADAKREGVQLLSGHSASTFKTLISTLGMSSIDTMKKVLTSERYAPITIS